MFVSGTGVPLGNTIVLDDQAGFDTNAQVVALADGGFAVTWSHSEPGAVLELDIRARAFNADGTPRPGSLFSVFVDSAPSLQFSSISALASGGYVVVYEGGEDQTVNFKRYDANGSPLDFARVKIDDGGYEPSAVGLADGGFAVAYQAADGHNGDDVKFSIFNADGTNRTPALVVNSPLLGGHAASHLFAGITILGNGLIAVDWQEGGAVGEQVFDANGNAIGTNQIISFGSIASHAIVGLGGANLAEVTENNDSSIRTQIHEFTRTFESDNANDTLTGINDGLREVFIGGGGDDIIVGGTGRDGIDGGDGIDTASYITAAAGVSANLVNPTLNTGDAAGDTYRSIENLVGSAFGDTLVGD